MKSELQIKYNVLVNHKFEKIADDYAIEFAEYVLKNYDGNKTGIELLREFKKEKGL